MALAGCPSSQSSITGADTGRLQKKRSQSSEASCATSSFLFRKKTHLRDAQVEKIYLTRVSILDPSSLYLQKHPLFSFNRLYCVLFLPSKSSLISPTSFLAAQSLSFERRCIKSERLKCPCALRAITLFISLTAFPRSLFPVRHEHRSTDLAHYTCCTADLPKPCSLFR